ncbi:MAG: endonuclease MutS2 [Bacteroidota bacterium]
MSVYPQDFSEKLNISQLFDLVRTRCKTTIGRKLVDKCKPSSDYATVTQWIDQTHELTRIISSGDPLPSRDFMDIQPLLVSMKIAGSFLPAEEFLQLRISLDLLYDWTQYLKKRQDQFPELCRLTYGFIADKELPKLIDSIIDERGQVRDNASDRLREIRTDLVNKSQAVRKVINSILKKAKTDGLTEDSSEVTIREGRLVIPLKAENKRRISGFVHDESSSGQTVFLEPAEALQLNNEVRELLYEEKREINKILTRLSDKVREHMEDLEKGGRFIGIFDFIYAKATFCKSIDAVKPSIAKYPVIKIYKAYHPLLKISHDQSGKPTIPLSIELTRQGNRILVISGPNAGGKSVSLKTVGIIQYMFQSGFLVPLSEASELGIFKNIFLDIGDSQSVENDLSTYSSHLTAMKHFVEHADEHTLFLIDEFGTGTEPQFGGAIAESILSELMSRKSFGVVTTHYANLKEFGEHHPGIVNGAMKYDVSALTPLFELEVGKPGSSFAFEIARNIGLSKQVISNARSLVGRDHVDYEKLLTQLEKERRDYEKLRKQTEKEQAGITDLRADYESLKAMLAEDRQKILKEAKDKARQIVDEANRKIEHTIRSIQESKADKQRTKDLRESVAKYKDSLVEQKPKKVKTETLKPGDWVSMEGQDLSGEILNIKGKQAQVRFGNLISFVDFKKLIKGQRREHEKSVGKKAGNFSMIDKRAQFQGELNVIGQRAEEALINVDQYIDEAIMLGTDMVRITHGKGHGILRDMIRNHLKKHPMVDRAVDEHVEMGGSGVTLVVFK